MSIAKRNPETGKIETNGSKTGAVLEWVRWVSQVILIPVLVAGFWWAASVQKFMWQGDRYTASDARAIHAGMDAVWEAKFNALPPDEFVLRVDEKFVNLEGQIEDLRGQDQRHYEEVLKRLERLENLMMRMSR